MIMKEDSKLLLCIECTYQLQSHRIQRSDVMDVTYFYLRKYKVARLNLGEI
jgi:hypothetical protein